MFNQPVLFSEEDSDFSFEFKLPTLKDIYSNEDVSKFINFLSQDLEVIKKWSTVDVKSHYDFMMLLLLLESKNISKDSLGKSLLKGLNHMVPIIQKGQVLYIKDNVLTPSLFNEIMEVLFMSLGQEKTIIKESDDEFDRMEKEQKLRAQAIRNRAGDKNKKRNKCRRYACGYTV